MLGFKKRSVKNNLIALESRNEKDNNERLQRIIAEFKAGYDLLETIDRAITIFGSGRVKENDPHYLAAKTLAAMFAKDGFTVVTGGGPGIMEAANRGAKEAGGRSIGFNIKIQKEQKNSFAGESVAFDYLFIRKVMLASAGEAYVFFPGGFGTLDEFFEISTLININKLHENVPIVLIGHDYWDPLIDYLRGVVVHGHNGFDEANLSMWGVVDTPREAHALVKRKIRAERIYKVYHHEA